MTLLYNRKPYVHIRKKLRNDLTYAEKKLWYQLQNKNLAGYEFRRQYGVGKFILDFFCVKARLGIEIDGDSHFENGADKKDFQRQKFVESVGIKILRFTNNEVYHNMEGVLNIIAKNLPPPAPPYKGGKE